MMPERKTAEVKSRIEPSIKKEAARYLRQYDISLSHGIKLFLLEVVAAKGLPFDLRPNKETRAAIKEIEKGGLKTYSSYEDMMKDIDDENDD